jgi:hypothetical protein
MSTYDQAQSLSLHQLQKLLDHVVVNCKKLYIYKGRVQ